jgi:hypothetical protein
MHKGSIPFDVYVFRYSHIKRQAMSDKIRPWVIQKLNGKVIEQEYTIDDKEQAIALFKLIRGRNPTWTIRVYDDKGKVYRG